jgi:ribosomal protein S6--L-glutamate ligase
MKAAVISLGSKSSQWTAEAMKQYFDSVDMIDVRYLEITFSGKKEEILYKGDKLGKFDCILAKGSFRYASILQSLSVLQPETTYLPIGDQAFTVAHDKLLTQLELQRANIPMPTTYMASTIEAARSILKRLNYPIIMKFPQGTQGKGVLFAESFASASSILDALSSLRQPFIIQEYIETGGVDIRAFVIGGEVVAAYQRRAKGDEKRANIHAGGTGETIELDAETRRIAVRAAKALEADICGVDILPSHRGPVVLEVNISPGLQGVTEHTGIDVADLIAKHCFDETKKFMTENHGKKSTKILSEIEHLDKEDVLITTLDFRGSRVLLPEVITKAGKFKDEQDYEFNVKPGKVTITRFDV